MQLTASIHVMLPANMLVCSISSYATSFLQDLNNIIAHGGVGYHAILSG